MKKDWIDTFNDIAEEHAQDDKAIIEEMIMFLAEKKLGDKFLSWYRHRADKGFTIG